MARDFNEIRSANAQEKKFLCVGLDTKVDGLPFDQVAQMNIPCLRFNLAIVEATKDIVGAYKVNLAFYSDDEIEQNLARTFAEGKKIAPNALWILDAKYGDIESTNEGYVEKAFEKYGADAVTVHHTMGMEAMRPFLDRKEKGIFVICKTSNKGSGEFQDLNIVVSDDMRVTIADSSSDDDRSRSPPEVIRMHEWVALRVSSAKGWNYNGNCGLVVGATYPQHIATIRRLAPEIPFLIPGIGAQGGDLKKTVAAARDNFGSGMFINSSRGIIHASRGMDFAIAAAKEAARLDTAIRSTL